MSAINNAVEAERYGNLCRVALSFHINTGNPAELDAATCYARAAAYFANRHMRGDIWTGQHQYASTETAYGRTVVYPWTTKVF